MDNSPLAATETRPAAKPSPKLRAALEYLGDRLVTHPASRFKPRTDTLLDTWLASRRRSLARPRRDCRSWLTTADLLRVAANDR
jgi:hypothetical protein